MKLFFLVVISIFLLSGCIGPKRYTRHIAAGLKNEDTLVVATSSAIRIIAPAADSTGSGVVVVKGPHFFIPAIFYWGIKESFSCDLGSVAPLKIFNNECYRYADANGLVSRLNGKRLEITVNSLPRKFVFSERMDVIFFVLFYFVIGQQWIEPKNTDLDVSYKVFDGKQVTQQGNILVKDIVKPYENNNKTTKKLTRIYLHRYQESVKRMSLECMSRLERVI